MKLSQVGELGLLAELERRGLAQAIENDAAQVDGLVVTQDALVEGVHFRLDWISWRDLGWRAAAVNLSDLAASGAEPVGLVVSLAASGDDEPGRRARAVRGDRRDGRAGGRRRHDALRAADAERDGARPVRARPRALRRAAGRPARRDRAARRGRRGVSQPRLRASAAPARGGPPPRDRGERDARPLRRPVAGRRPHRRALGRPLRDRPRARPARRRRDRRGPRLRRGLRAARGDPRPARLHRDRALRGRRRSRGNSRTPAGSTSARACRGARRAAARAPSRSPRARCSWSFSSRLPRGRRT